MIAAWICPRRLPGWWTRPLPSRPRPISRRLGARLAPRACRSPAGALTLAVPHPIIARRTWLWRADTARGDRGAGLRRRATRRGRARLARRAWPGATGHGRPWTGRSAAGLGSDAFPGARRGRMAARGRALRGRAAWRCWRRGRRWRRCSRLISAGAVRRGCRPGRCGAARARPSGRRCSMPICAASRRSPRQRSRQR